MFMEHEREYECSKWTATPLVCQFFLLELVYFIYLNIILNKCTLYVKQVYILFKLSIGHDYKLGLWYLSWIVVWVICNSCPLQWDVDSVIDRIWYKKVELGQWFLQDGKCNIPLLRTLSGLILWGHLRASDPGYYTIGYFDYDYEILWIWWYEFFFLFTSTCAIYWVLLSVQDFGR